MFQKIAVLIDHFHPYQSTVLTGIRHVLDQHNMGSTVLIGRNLHDPSPGIRRANDIYSLARTGDFAGLIVFSVSMGIYASDQDLNSFVDTFQPLPTVCIGRRVETYPTVEADNIHGMESLIHHLIEVRKFTRLAFMRGIPGNQDSEVREEVFRRCVTQKGLTVHEPWMLTGNFSSSGAQQALEAALKESSPDFQVVVCANDEMAHGAITLLSQRGIRVPEDIAVVGFDDSEEFRHVVPALTTVRQPFFEQGVQAAEALMKLLQNQPVDLQLLVPTRLVVRESCGASPAPAGAAEPAPQSPDLTLLEHMAAHWLEALQQKNPLHFLGFWRSLLLERPLLDEEFNHWQGLLLQASVRVEMELQETQWPGFSRLKDQAFTTLNSALQMVHSTRRIHNVTRAMHLPVMFSAGSSMELHTEIRQHLQHLSLKPHVLVLRDLEDETKSQVVLSDGVKGAETQPFPSHQILPSSLEGVLNASHTLVTPLFEPERMLGHLVYRPPSDLFFDEESLCYTLSRAVQHHLQQQRLVQNAERLEELVRSRTRELEALNLELQRSAFLDGLTGIYNRTAFKDHLARLWAQHLRKGAPLGLILCDVDHFKRYNDTYGHLQGDACLRQVAEVMASSIRRGDVVARFGGEEFVVLLPETRLSGVIQVAERIQQELQGLQIPHEGSDVSPFVTLSLGVTSQVPTCASSAEELVKTADLLLYEAKRQGRARWVDSGCD
ncbi:diguanylate cyclase domain-containing protein [Deinococcus cellulosilyticus]|uniref:GGDEF domain-containing protein n=1 Tax=Deinococcus cellulosilyticus (strain DSM 18568 / NBRC 106333 / KACC 11606 / 5516J-15) TaxID=1223518 RepID=A0A511N264_DEIC1|nr:diguanylate cyclase [Deinococcus cellulosilyticus]GEM46943.1 hypothetical protein DC3_25780 [Deinococcus cellulosilyticus NBRC 106333 = KACC 11606]